MVFTVYIYFFRPVIYDLDSERSEECNIGFTAMCVMCDIAGIDFLFIYFFFAREQIVYFCLIVDLLHYSTEHAK